MLSTRSVMLLTTALSAVLAPVAQAAPAPQQSSAAGSSDYWLANMKHQGTVWGNSDSSYQIFRTAAAPSGGDDSDAIQQLLDGGNRCGNGCNSSTTTPAIIYFPGGTYMIGKPLNLTYYTQIIGDPNNRPIFKPLPTFVGMGMMDSDPYNYETGAAVSWYINTNNFFRQIRNVVFDLRGSANNTIAIHWQVAQATSLQNIDFKMDVGSGQRGVSMDNGSGGFCSDLTFEGGGECFFAGSQQFTSRNLQFTNCGTAIFMNWDWGWTFNNISISGGAGQTGMDMSVDPNNQSVGSVVLSDSKISGVEYGVKTSYGGNDSMHLNVPATGGTLILQNVDFSGTQNAVYQVPQSKTVLTGNTVVASWSQGNSYVGNGSKQTNVGAISNAPKLPQSLTTSTGAVFGRSKPQYENVAASNFISAKDSGCKGDGENDDTKAVQDFLNKVAGTPNAIAFFDHGAYLVTNTILVPQKIKIVGEIWSMIVADGSSFNDAKNPKPVFQVGKPNSQGAVEISDMLFEIKGPAPGAIMIEWNLNSAQGESGMWDSHVRIGGSVGSELLMEQCRGHTGVLGSPGEVNPPKAECQGVFMMFHATKQSGGFVLENDWFWVADHDMEDSPGQTQINIYSGRGALFQSQGPIWLWGTASEHSIMYNYQLDGVKAFFGGFMQTETPYFQPSPEAPTPLSFNSAYDDPTFTICSENGTDADGVPCKDSWGMRIVNSQNVFVYSTGMYSFFNKYTQQCTFTANCQENMIRIQNSQVYMYAVTTKASVNMLRVDANAPIVAADNEDIYGDTIAHYFSK